MLVILIAFTLVICLGAALLAYLRDGDVFHPALIIGPMCLFVYVYMPAKLINSKDLFTFVSEEQATSYQLLVVFTLAMLFAGTLVGSRYRPTDVKPLIKANRDTLHMGGYLFGGIGFLAFAYTVHNAGGFATAFGSAYGGGWSDIGYIRDAAYLTIVAMVILLSQEAFDPKNKVWLIAVALFSTPWLAYAFLGARRGPTFMIAVCIGMSWFMARGKRPSIFSLLAGGTALGMLMLFLVTNRSHICLKCDLNLTTNVSGVVASVDEGNEYIFGTGCVMASRAEGKCYWGKRYLAQVLVRPIPRQIWPTKYQDTGLEDLLQNAGVAGRGLKNVMGWGEVPGAAATVVADMWVEFGWLEIPVAFLLGWTLGRVWRLGVTQMGFWMTEYIILSILSIYLITQSGEAVISRFIILSVPAILVWRKARADGSPAEPVGTQTLQTTGAGRILHA